MAGYYADKLSGERLKQVYETAPPRIRQYLDAEVTHVLSRIKPGDHVLELGCGYGRILPRLAEKAGLIVGIDNAMSSLRFGRPRLRSLANCHLVCMDASQLAFGDRSFDVVLCIQNGLSAFQINRRDLIRESLSVTRPGGLVVFSTYAERFWEERLAWFELQAKAGLLGEIDYDRTGDGVIAGKDGFIATTISRDEFQMLTANLDADISIFEIDDSSLICELRRHR